MTSRLEPALSVLSAAGPTLLVTTQGLTRRAGPNLAGHLDSKGNRLLFASERVGGLLGGECERTAPRPAAS